MSAAPRLVVAAREAGGSSVVMSDKSVSPTVVRAYPGVEFYLLWGTEDGGATLSDWPPLPTLLPFYAGQGGTRLLLARYAPESTVTRPTDDPADLAREAREKLPGLAEVFESPDSGMHATDTIDYGICLEGELYLELDNGKEVLLTPGSYVVQLGARHAWHNRGDKSALMCFVGIGARRDAMLNAGLNTGFCRLLAGTGKARLLGLRWRAAVPGFSHRCLRCRVAGTGEAAVRSMALSRSSAMATRTGLGVP